MTGIDTLTLATVCFILLASITIFIQLQNWVKQTKFVPPKIIWLSYWVTVSLFVFLLILFNSPLEETIPSKVTTYLVFGLWLIIGYLILSIIDTFLIQYFLINTRHLHIATPLRRILFVIVYISIILYLLWDLFNYNPLALLAIPTILTAGVAFAMQDTLKRFIASMTLSRFLHPGDWIIFDNNEGRVIDVSWSCTTIQLWDESKLVIPNNLLQMRELRRITKTYRCEVSVNVDYNIPPEYVKQTILDCITGIPFILVHPAAVVYINKYDEFAIKYVLYFWITDYTNILMLTNEVYSRIWYAFKRNNIQIPLSTYRTHFTGESKPVSNNQFKHWLTLAEKIDLFHPFSNEEKEKFVAMLKEETYAPDEIIIREGDTGNSFFIIIDGIAEVVVQTVAGELRTVSKLQSGEYFGEMSLLTGESRNATVKAVTETTVAVLESGVFQTILLLNPDLAEELADILVQRQTQLDQIKKSILPELQPQPATQKTFSQRIRKFFALR